LDLLSLAIAGAHCEIWQTIVIKRDWEDHWKDLWYIKIPWMYAFLALWSLWPELLSDESFASGSVWIYFGLWSTIGLTWLLSALGTVGFLADRICGGCVDAFEDYGLGAPALMGPPLLVCGLLYMYRSGVPEYEDESSSWSMLVHTLTAVYVALGLAASVMSDDSESSVGTIVFFGVVVFMQDAAGPARPP
jgi:hypothetical protein